MTASNTALQDPVVVDLSVQANNVEAIEGNVLDSSLADGKTYAKISEEWEQLVVLEMPKISSPACISKTQLHKEVSSPPQSTATLDDKTSRILERLEIPKQLKRKAVSPTVSAFHTVSISSVKKPLVPFGPSNTDSQAIVLSQPIKPNFQRLKRKR